MSITIKHKKSAVASSKPTGAQIDNGEIAVNYSDTDPALYIKDSTGAVIRIAGNGAVGTSSSSAVAPTTPADGDTWVDTSVHPPSMKVWDATTSKWEVIGSSGSGTAPATPATGAVWVDTSAVPNVIKVWDGGNWVLQAGATTTDSVAPAAPATGQMWVDTSASPSPIKIWDGSSWVTTAATGAASQALANDAKYATKAEVQAEDLWDRTGTEIHPKTAGDGVFTSGGVKVGGTTGAPNISLNAGGTAVFAPGTNKSLTTEVVALGTGSAIVTGLIEADGRKQASSKSAVSIRDTAGVQTAVVDNSGSIRIGGNLTTFPSSPNISLNVNGSAEFSSDVKIGGTLPASPNITLNANGSATFVGGDVNIDSSSRLLVGRSTTDTGFNSGVQIAGLGGSNAGSQLISRFSADAASPSLWFYKSRGTTIGANTIVNNGDDIGSLGFYGANGASVDEAARITAQIDGTPGATSDMPGRLVFSTTADGASSPTERLLIGSSGDVKIGGMLPASPNIKLEANGNIHAVGLVHSGTVDLANNTTAKGVQISYGGNVVVQREGTLASERAFTVYKGSTETLALYSDGSAYFGGTLPSAPNIRLEANGNIHAVGLAAAGRVYADNTAAKAGGLVDGDFYRKADGTLMVAYT